MKIGILTLPLHTNYGGILQAYALQIVLERMGHLVTVLDSKQHKSKPGIKAIFKRCLLKSIGKYKKPIFIENIYNKTYPEVSVNTQRFIDKYINNVFTPLNELKESDYDAYIVGSDQIWRPSYYQPIQNAFLFFTEGWNVKRIAYAPSLGTDTWEYTESQEIECKHLIHLFDAVSCREASGTENLKKHFKVNVKHVLDPTMLLNAEDYTLLIEKEKGLFNHKGEILNYVLDMNLNIQDIINNIVKDQKKLTFKVNSRFEEYDAPVNERIQPSVESWLKGFKDADLVLTDSFHACVFSILFHKDFIVIANKERGLARFHSLLSMFGLEDRLITNMEEYCKIKNRPIDYQKVDSLLEEKRKLSMSFLIKALR